MLPPIEIVIHSPLVGTLQSRAAARSKASLPACSAALLSSWGRTGSSPPQIRVKFFAMFRAPLRSRFRYCPQVSFLQMRRPARDGTGVSTYAAVCTRGALGWPHTVGNGPTGIGLWVRRLDLESHDSFFSSSWWGVLRTRARIHSTSSMSNSLASVPQRNGARAFASSPPRWWEGAPCCRPCWVGPRPGPTNHTQAAESYHRFSSSSRPTDRTGAAPTSAASCMLATVAAGA